MPTDRPPMRVFIVNTGALPTLHANAIEAAYYKSEAGFTTFKDADNQSVFTVRDDHLVSVERAHGAEPVIAAFRDLLREAAKNGGASGTITAERTTDPDGRVYSAGYHVTVTTQADAEVPSSDASVAVSVRGSVLSTDDLSEAVRRNGLSGDGPVPTGV